MIETKAVFERKSTGILGRDCVIKKIIWMTDSELEDYSRNLTSDRPFIQENVALMYNDNGVYHCLLVVGETSPDGILIEAEGYNYARYAAFLPNARALVQEELKQVADRLLKFEGDEPSQGFKDIDLSKFSKNLEIQITEEDGSGKMFLEVLKNCPEVLEASLKEDHLRLTLSQDYNLGFQKTDKADPLSSKSKALEILCENIEKCVEKILQIAEERDQPEYSVSYKMIREETGINVEFNDAILTVVQEMLLERPEISSLDAGESEFFLTVLHKNTQGENECGHSMFRDLLACKWEDLHLIHDKIDNGPATIVEISSSTLTAAGREAWADILNAEVKRVYTGIYGLQMELSGVKASRLDEFSHMLAGYCAESEYDLWVSEGKETCQQMNL